jgi:glycosyltransferase involved in cell wall biosynthesis
MIFRSGDAAHLAEVLIRLKDSPELMSRLGRAALDYVHREREWLVIVQRYRQIYEELTRRRLKAGAGVSA